MAALLLPLLMPLLSLLVGHSGLLVGGIFAALLIVYLLARADLVRVFASQGAWFTARACGVMYALDLVRFTCVLAAVSIRVTGHKLLVDHAHSVHHSNQA